MARGKDVAAPLPPWVPPDWYPDPLGIGAARYWDGRNWSKHHRDAPPPQPVPSRAGVEAQEQAQAQERAATDAQDAAKRAANEAQAAAKRELEARRGRVVAKYSPGLTAIRLYQEGTIESKMHGSGSVIGATARVDQSGSQRIFRDTRQGYLTIEGPHVAISAKLGSNSGATVTLARKFAAAVNQLADQLAPAAPPAPTPVENTSIPDQISKLAELRDRGILTEQEFDAKKAELLERM